MSGAEEWNRQAIELMPLVRRMALKMRVGLPPNVELDDLVSAGALGLLDAVRKFDSAKGVKLASYARHRIRGAILDDLRSLDTASRDMRRMSKEVERVCRKLEAARGRPVDSGEAAREFGVSLEEWHRTVRMLHNVGSNDLRSVPWRHKRPSADGWGAIPPFDHASIRQLTDPSPFERCYREERVAILRAGLAAMPDRIRQVIALYYDRALTMKQVASRLGIDQSRVSQLHAIALVRLRKRVQAILRGERRIPERGQVSVAPAFPDLARGAMTAVQV